MLQQIEADLAEEERVQAKESWAGAKAAALEGAETPVSELEALQSQEVDEIIDDLDEERK